MPLINCEVNLELTWSKYCVITNSTGVGKFEMTWFDLKFLYVPVVTLSTQDSVKLLQQLKSGFKRTTNWNKYESSIKTFAKNRYLNYLINPGFQGVNRLFVLSFEDEDARTSHSTHYLPKVEIKDYNIIKIVGRNLFDQPINRTTKTYEYIRKITTGQGDDYTTGCLLDYSYFDENYKIIAIDLSKQQALDADPRAIQQINFTANLDRDDGATIFFIIEQTKETVFESLQGTVKVLWIQSIV